MTSVHILIAVVAIIECILLVTFTTFSWIESNSSLVIQNGPESSQVDTNVTKKMDIASQLNSTIDLNYSSEDFAELNSFFSEVKYFEFAKATSSDGRTMFFPCKNNTCSSAGKYRRGDTIDYNTSYLYFDFIVSNRGAGDNPVENRDVYFDADAAYSSIFSVTGDGLSAEQKTALCNAMRMSITTQSMNSSTVNTKIYAKKAYSGSSGYQSVDVNATTLSQSYAYDGSGDTADNINTWVTTYPLAASVYATDSNNVITSDKLFVIKKNSETKVSFRIWFDYFDPDFRSVFGLDEPGFSFSDANSAYAKIPKATVGVKFKLKTSGNDLRSIYFDDYTFTNNTGVNIKHLTDENPDYSVWFYAYQPGIEANEDHPERTEGYYYVPLERENSDASHTRWAGSTATASMMEYLMNEGGYANAAGVSNAADRVAKSYFCYGDYSTKTAIYKWELPAAPGDDDFTFNAYSYMPNSSYTPVAGANGWSDCSGTGVKLGVGIWQDNDPSRSMTLLKFKDMATAVVSGNNYNSGNNFRIMNAAAVADAHTHYLVFVNNYNNATAANNFTSDVEKITAAMYYDDTEKVFEAYVPASWLTGSTGVSFTYCPGGVFSNSTAALRWYSGASAATLNGGEYVYTALGYSNPHNQTSINYVGYTPTLYSSINGFLKGVGTWGAVEQIKFCTDMIDDSLNASYRYFIGYADSYSAGYYVMIPDASNMTFSAYVPAAKGSTAAEIKFLRYNAAKTASGSSDAPAAYWYSTARRNSYGADYSTFYPVDCTGTSTTEYTHGYWNLSVLVDGTYENLIYDTLTDGSAASYAPVVTTGTVSTAGSIDYSPRVNYGLLQFSYDGTSWNTVCDDATDTTDYSSGGAVIAKMHDRYRFYVNAEGRNVVYWRWTPYAAYSCTIYVDDDNDAETDNVSKTFSAEDTQFTYTHDVASAAATGIYKVVTEAPHVPDSP